MIMSMYRCAACGSSHVVVDTKKEGFSVGKAVVGTAVFGAGGAVMGVNGKEKLYYHCAACGQTLSYPMQDFQKDIIDRYLSNPAKYSSLLEDQKKHYPNIEWDKNVSTETNVSTKTNERLSESDLANEIWNYYIRTQTPYISIQTLGSEVIKNNRIMLTSALRILEKRGVLIVEKKDGLNYCRFCSDSEEIQNNINKVLNRTEEETAAALDALLACSEELSMLKRAQQKSELCLSGTKYTLFRDAVIKALSGDVMLTSKNLEGTSEELMQYSSRILVANLTQMVEEGLIEKNNTYYSLSGAAMRNKEKEEQRLLEEEKKRIAREKLRQQRIEEAKAYNKQINEQLEVLQEEKKEQEIIYVQNKNKIFGAGAKAKNAALDRMVELDVKIRELRSQMKPEL